MEITTDDCKIFLSKIYDSKENDWKRIKKYKIDNVWFRDFENISDSYIVTLKEKNGNLYLVNKNNLSISNCVKEPSLKK